MSVAEKIKQILEKNFDPEHLHIRNDSHKHKGHAGDDGSGESHFHVTIVCAQFETMSRMDRHRNVYAVLEPLIDGGLHALSMKLLSPEEYAK